MVQRAQEGNDKEQPQISTNRSIYEGFNQFDSHISPVKVKSNNMILQAERFKVTVNAPPDTVELK